MRRKRVGQRPVNFFESTHRELIGRLDDVHPNTVLKVKTFRQRCGSWSKYLVIKSTGEKLMLLTALIKGKTPQYMWCNCCQKRRRTLYVEHRKKHIENIFDRITYECCKCGDTLEDIK